MRKPLWMLLLVCLVLIQPLCLAAATSTDNWTTFRHDPNHSGYTTDDAPTNSAKPLWKFSTGAEVLSSPSIADGRVLVGSKDRNLYCLNASSGVLLWNFTAGGEIDSSPCI